MGGFLFFQSAKQGFVFPLFARKFLGIPLSIILVFCFLFRDHLNGKLKKLPKNLYRTIFFIVLKFKILGIGSILLE